ncbi:hypothetical protein GE253_10885 [Niveispirillum sp. SYP-B3756]|uniref:hypothetical protein n=1 Tax=Niveispirillum sp. SYP-B3756 TaxID=2662178 RepID=UPI001290BE2B|nr:hypothetical protein [Niveispirillum sp. SYP-B3756]MQP65846.1 hypothetical protein [Niveispirillum sp. SYP-B3756]
MKIIEGEIYIRGPEVNSGQYVHFLAGKKISVETFAIEAGGHDFNYQVMSRATANGKPESILTTQRALEREFWERRYVRRTFAPISVGRGSDGPKLEITYGEVSPQVYVSSVETDIVAWSIQFLWHRLAKAGGARLSASKTVRARQGVAVGQGTAQLNTLPDLAAHLRVHIPSADSGKYNLLKNGLGTSDVIGTDKNTIGGWLTRVFDR